MSGPVVRRRVSATVIDQVFASASNFLVGIVVARLASPSAFGAFALAYSIWLLLAGVHRALIVNPMMVAGPESRGAGRLEQALAAEVVLGLTGASVVALAGGLLILTGSLPLGWALIGLAPWLPVLLIQDLWRWAGFMRGLPARSLVNDIAFTVTQVLLLASFDVTGHLGTNLALAAWGGGALVGAAIGARQFDARLRLVVGRGSLRQSWLDGRWLLADFVTSFGTSQGWQILVATVLGPAALGLVRAAYNLMGPTNVLLFGSSGYGLPASVEALHNGGWKQLDAVVRRITVWVTLGIAACALPLAIGHDLLVEFVYGPQYRGIGDLAVLVALSFIAIGTAFGAMIGLTAARKTRPLFLARVSAAVVSAAAFMLLAGSLGVVAAGWAGLFGSLSYTALMWLAYRSAHRTADPSSQASGQLLRDAPERRPTTNRNHEQDGTEAVLMGRSHQTRSAYEGGE